MFSKHCKKWALAAWPGRTKHHFLTTICHSSQVQAQTCWWLYVRKFSSAGSHCGPKTLQQKWPLSTVLKWWQMVVYEVGDPKTLKVLHYGHIQRGIRLWKLVKTICAPWVWTQTCQPWNMYGFQKCLVSRVHIPFESRPNKLQNAAEKPPLNQVYKIVVHKWFIVYKILMPTGSGSFRLQSIRKIVHFVVWYCFPVQELLFVWFVSPPVRWRSLVPHNFVWGSCFLILYPDPPPPLPPPPPPPVRPPLPTTNLPLSHTIFHIQ